MFYDRINNLCREKGIKLSPLLDELGISTGSISYWKKGKSPSNNILVLLADYFDTTTDYLLGKTDKKNKPTVIDDNYELTSKEEDLIELFRQLSPEQQEIVLRAAGLDPREVDKG